MDRTELAAGISSFEARVKREEILEPYRNLWPSFFESGPYVHWLKGRSWQLCLFGPPQCGKTTLAAAVANDLLLREWPPDERIAVVSLFLGDDELFDESSPAAIDSILRAIIRQLFEDIPDAADWARSLPEDFTIRSLETLLDQAFQGLSAVFVIVDAIELCPPSVSDELDAAIEWLQQRGARLMVTRSAPRSTHIPERYKICDFCDTEHLELYWTCVDCSHDICMTCYSNQLRCLELGHDVKEDYSEVIWQVRTSNEDLAIFLRDRIETERGISHPPPKLDERLSTAVDELVDKVTSMSNGVFVIAKAYIDYLWEECDLDAFNELTVLLPRVSKPEARFFDELMAIISNESADQLQTLQALSIISQVEMAGCAISFNQLSDVLSGLSATGSRIERGTLLRMARGTLQISSDNYEQVTLFHQDFAVYLRENCDDAFGTAIRVDMTSLCLDYLISVPEPTQNMFTDDRWPEQFRAEHAFGVYAATNWGFHLENSSDYKTLDPKDDVDAESVALKALGVLCSERLNTCLYLACTNELHSDFTLWPGSLPLHLCAWFGLTKLVVLLLREQPDLDLNLPDPIYKRTPLLIAAQRGKYEFVEQLLDLGADPTLECSEHRSALLEAVHQNYGGLTELLLDRESRQIITSEPHETTPLIAALPRPGAGDATTFQMLLDHRSIDPSEAVANGETALMKAIDTAEFDTTFVNLLLESPRSMTGAIRRSGYTALHIASIKAAEERQYDTLQAIFESPSCKPRIINAKDKLGRVALMLLLEHAFVEDEEICRSSVQEFIRKGAALQTKDHNGRGLIHYVAAGNCPTVLCMLKEQSVIDLDSTDNEGWTALHVSCCKGNLEMARELLALGSAASSSVANGMTPGEMYRLYHPNEDHHLNGVLEPLSAAVQTELPLPLWARIRADPSIGLDSASAAELQVCDPYDRNTLLHWAVSQPTLDDGMMALIDKLLQICDVNTANRQGETPLQCALAAFIQGEGDSRLIVVERLLAQGAKFEDGQSLIAFARERKLWEAAVRMIESSTQEITFGSDFSHLLEASIDLRSPDAIDVLMRSGLHPLKRYRGRLPAQVAAHRNGDEAILTFLKEWQQFAIARLWESHVRA